MGILTILQMRWEVYFKGKSGELFYEMFNLKKFIAKRNEYDC